MRREERLERIAAAMEDKKMVDTQDDAAKEKMADRIQNILHLTNEERSKRGRYTNLSQETRDEIAEYALQYGEQEAVEHFSRNLYHTISLNAVRNYCKVYQLYSSELRK
ncbi:uncharacterized protein LOC111703424, partial [Eurytemora carolleeae]|uniref:uncharacterized protein LOC111703424 n=1 Tax=Eurytemora carolleeae TaxID=1294199 RepID=UPI000C773EF9